MNELSIIEEVVLEQMPKAINETTNKSEDSGMVSAESSSIQSGKKNIKDSEELIIIPFQALNAKPESVKESTFVNGGSRADGSCNISKIENEVSAQTVNSEDGKSSINK